MEDTLVYLVESLEWTMYVHEEEWREDEVGQNRRKEGGSLWDPGLILGPNPLAGLRRSCHVNQCLSQICT
jgi:hypothetical protein